VIQHTTTECYFGGG